MTKENTSKNTDKKSSRNLTGSRFIENPSTIMSEINASIEFDKRLCIQDITVSRAHCRMLVTQDIIAKDDGEAILASLDQIENEIASGDFLFDPVLEDIHMHIENRLHELIGEIAGRLHTARSRNDQVSTDLRLWIREKIDSLLLHMLDLQKALIDCAEEHVQTILPGLTHLQNAQPTTLGHHFLAYVEMTERDISRLKDCQVRLNESPLGSGALAGTSFPIDRDATASYLGFDSPMRNSLDAVSSRDFAIEFLSCCAIASVHLSRLAEEIVLWMSEPFHFISLSDAFSTGSSMMPQKRNPDAAELIRSKPGRIIGNLNTLLIIMKGLPLAYAKDLQEDKEPIFDSADTLSLCLQAMTGMIKDLVVNKKAMQDAATRGYATATDLADWFVRKLNLPFREAHRITGRIVNLAENFNCRLDELPLEEMQKVDTRVTDDIFSVLGVEESVASRTSMGGTAPIRVTEALTRLRKRLK